MGNTAGLGLPGVQDAYWAQPDALPGKAITIDTPFGLMTLVQRGEHISELRFESELRAEDLPGNTPLLEGAQAQLREYFSGRRQTFDLPLAPRGTPFQMLVWRTLYATVPYGSTVSYGELARRCEKPNAARAVGMANHYNPLPVLIPCHRVIGAGGKLVGYGGGLTFKERLLALEGAAAGR